MKSNKTQSLVTRLVILFFVTVLIAWGGWLWWRDSISPVDPNNTTPIIFVVESGQGVKAIAANLVHENLIRSPTGFYILVKLLGIEKDLQAGDFRLNKSMDARTIALEMTHGILDVWVTTLEGWRAEEVASRLSKDLDIPENEFLAVAHEGYMFPDTYLIPRDATSGAVAKTMLDNFNTKITSKMREDAKKTGLSFDKVMILASIVEREGRSDSDRPIIAAILLKRLKAGWPLQADATLQYALGYQPFEKTWWKKEITETDKLLDSPYNTYANVGLPPTPIANPGLAAIKAVIYAPETEYWFYLHDRAGTAHFAKTIEEHNANIQKYLQ